VAADVYRPAAVQQLVKLGVDLEVPVFTDGGANPPEICEKALQDAPTKNCDVVIIDTAGRLTVDEPLMEELSQIQARTSPENVLLVCDAMIGQESVNIAKAFNERLRLTGFILTKLDGDARGGAALSIKEATGVPIKFIGMGEGLDRLEEFRPDGLASRILGFGDVVGLVKDFEEVVDEKKAEEDALRMLAGNFTFTDFLAQIRTLKKMGPLQDVIEKIPFLQQAAPNSDFEAEGEMACIESMINSMTPGERDHPDIIDESRRKRIARGSGRTEGDVRDLVSKFKKMRTLMAALGGGKVGGPFKRLRGLGRMLSGELSPGMGSGLGGFGPGGLGLPEVGRGQPISKKAQERKKKKRKQEKIARKKGRKR
jgi:signal recognition particle subunit SRP54